MATRIVIRVSLRLCPSLSPGLHHKGAVDAVRLLDVSGTLVRDFGVNCSECANGSPAKKMKKLDSNFTKTSEWRGQELIACCRDRANVGVFLCRSRSDMKLGYSFIVSEKRRNRRQLFSVYFVVRVLASDIESVRVSSRTPTMQALKPECDWSLGLQNEVLIRNCFWSYVKKSEIAIFPKVFIFWALLVEARHLSLWAEFYFWLFFSRGYICELFFHGCLSHKLKLISTYCGNLFVSFSRLMRWSQWLLTCSVWMQSGGCGERGWKKSGEDIILTCLLKTEVSQQSRETFQAKRMDAIQESEGENRIAVFVRILESLSWYPSLARCLGLRGDIFTLAITLMSVHPIGPQKIPPTNKHPWIPRPLDNHDRPSPTQPRNCSLGRCEFNQHAFFSGIGNESVVNTGDVELAASRTLLLVQSAQFCSSPKKYQQLLWRLRQLSWLRLC